MLDLNNITHGEKLAAEIGIAYHPTMHVVLSKTDADGVLMGGVIYTNFTPVSVMAHMAGFKPMWLSRAFLWVFFDYPFVQLNLKKILACVSSGNPRALAIDKRIGFREVVRVSDVYGDGDLVLLEITRAECRWLGRRSLMASREAA
jgi:hypothetical protein